MRQSVLAYTLASIYAAHTRLRAEIEEKNKRGRLNKPLGPYNQTYI